MPSTLHSDYWVAVATAAPVIAIGHVFAVSEAFKLSTPRDKQPTRSRRDALMQGFRYYVKRPDIWLYVLGAGAIWANAIMLLSALGSLADGRDELSRELPTWVLALSTLLLTAEAGLARIGVLYNKLQRRRVKIEALTKELQAGQRRKTELTEKIARLRREYSQLQRQSRTELGVEPAFFDDHYENILAEGRRPKPGPGIERNPPRA